MSSQVFGQSLPDGERAVFNMSTYGMFPNEEEVDSSGVFRENQNMNIFDYLNLLFYGGGAVILFYYFPILLLLSAYFC